MPPTHRDGPSSAPEPYRELFERSADAILIIDRNRFVDCNQATVEMLRYESREALLQTHPSELSPPEQPDGRASFEKANEMMAIAFARGSHRFEWHHRRADGEVFPVEVLLTAVPRGERQILHVVWRDITDRKRLEGDLRQAQKMEAVGKLAGGIAHDFNNLLVSIIGHAELLGLQLGDDPKAATHVDEIVRAGERAAALVGQLLAFSRKQVLQPRVVDLHAVLTGLDHLLHRTLGEYIEIDSKLHDTPIHVLCDPNQLEQVVLNLATNARDAMEAGGRLSFETQVADLDETTIGARVDLPAGTYGVLSVTDTGQGIPPDVLDRIWEPFFTTKEVGRGTGLGLSTIHGIVRQSGGDISVYSEPGHGTVFKVYLPLSTQPAAPVQPRRSRRRARRTATERILLVEDDAAVARLVLQVLQAEGYRVVSARNGIEALEQVERQGGVFDLVLTDVVMPLMGGPDLVRQLRARGLQARVLYMSGYTDDALTRSGALEPEVALLQKPFSPTVLIDRVAEVIDGL